MLKKQLEEAYLSALKIVGMENLKKCSFFGSNRENPAEDKCSKCGLELHKVMWYYCSNSKCPTGLRSEVHL